MAASAPGGSSGSSPSSMRRAGNAWRRSAWRRSTSRRIRQVHPV